MLSKILVPLDQSEFSHQILQHLHRLAADADIETTLVHVLPDLLRAEPRDIDSHLDDARRLLQKGARHFKERNGSVRCETRMGNAVREICKLAILLPASLIAMSTHGRTGLDRVFHGSVAEGVLRNSTVPMFIFPSRRDESPEPPHEIRRILFPLDDAEMALELLPLVAHIAQRFDTHVYLYHDERGTTETTEFATKTDVPTLIRPLREQLEHKGVRVTLESSRLKSAAPEIVRKIDELEIDLVAMVTHGRSGFERGVFGSVTEAVLRHSRCPVLAKHTDRYRAKSDTEHFVTG